MAEDSPQAFIKFMNAQGKPDDFQEFFGIKCPDDKYGQYMHDEMFHQFKFDYEKWKTIINSKNKSQVDKFNNRFKAPKGTNKDLPIIKKVKSTAVYNIKNKKQINVDKDVNRNAPRVISDGEENKELGGVGKEKGIFNKVEYNLEPPLVKRSHNRNELVRSIGLWGTMRVENSNKASNTANLLRKLNRGALIRKLDDGTYRVWRIPPKWKIGDKWGE